MEEYKEIRKAIDQIDSWFKKIEEFQNSVPYLNETKDLLVWQQKVLSSIPDKREEIQSFIEGPVQNILSTDLNNFNLSFATGSTATILTGSTETINTIKSSGSEFRYLLSEYDNINPIDKLIDNISENLKLIDTALANQFEEVKLSYEQWKANLRSNSDLAKDTRTFQEEFEGIINKLRVPKTEWGITDIPKMSWNKMVEAIAKKGSVNRIAFMKQQKISEDIWEELTPVLKKDFELNKDGMQSLFKRYVEHVYSVLNLIDESIIIQ